MQPRSRSTREIARQLQKLHKLASDLTTVRETADYIHQLEYLECHIKDPSDSIAILSSSDETNAALAMLLSRAEGIQHDLTSFTERAVDSPDAIGELVVSSWVEGETQEIDRIQLEPHSSFILGRRPDNCRVLFSPSLSLISGVHAELRVDFDGKVEIRDLGSLNGTFLDGKRLSSNVWHHISLSDILTLGGSVHERCSAQLSFSGSANVNRVSYKSLPLITASCLVIVIKDRPSALASDYIVNRVRNSLASSVHIVIDCYQCHAKLEGCHVLQEKLRHVTSDTDVFCFSLRPFVPDKGSTLVLPEGQSDYQSFLAGLRDCSFSQVHLQRSAKRYIGQIAKSLESEIESALSYHTHLEESASITRDCGSYRLTGGKPEDIKRDLLSRYDNAAQSIRSLLAERKAEILDDYAPNSLARSLDKELSLLAVENRRHSGDQVCVTLKAPKGNPIAADGSVHPYMLSFCHALLKDWCNDLIVTITEGDHKAGLKSLYSDALTELKGLTRVKLQSNEINPKVDIDLSSILHDNIAPPSTSLLIRSTGFLGYIFKNLRGQIMSIGGTIVIIGGMLTPQIRDGIKDTLLPALLPLIAVVTWLAYNKELCQKTEEASGKIRKDIKSYYFNYLKIMLERVATGLLSSVSAEHSRFKQKLEELANSHFQSATDTDELSANKSARVGDSRLSSKILIGRLKRHLEALNKSIQDIHQISID